MGIRARSVALVVGLAASLVVFTGAVADGKSSYDSPYGYDRTWNATLRLVRVDLGLKVIEKDDHNGYVLFEYRSSESSKKTSSGSLELIRGSTKSARPDDVRVVAQLPEMPRSHEEVLLDELARKMRTEYGEPPEVRPPVVPDVPDAGTDPNEPSN